MRNLTTAIQGASSEGNISSERLLDFLKSFFGEYITLESWVVVFVPQIKINAVILQKNIFFNFEYTKIDNNVKATSVPIKNIDKVEETFNGTHYYCTYYSNKDIIFATNTVSIDLVRSLREFANLILAKM